MGLTPLSYRSWRWLSGLAVAVACTAAFAAHGALRRSAPAAGEQVRQAPRELRLIFNEPVELAFARLRLVGPGGAVALGTLALAPDSPAVLIGPIRGALRRGRHTVQWQIAGADGHPVRGDYTFTIAADAAGLTTDAGAPAPAERAPAAATQTPAFDASSPLYAAIRWLTFITLLGVIGAVAFRLVLRVAGLRSDPEIAVLAAAASRRAAGLGVWFGVMVLVLAVARLSAQSVASTASALFDARQFGTILTETAWGRGWVLQLAGGLTAVIGFLRARDHRPAGWSLAALGAIALASTPGLSGHAVATERYTPLPMLADGIHVLGAGGWLGSLLYVVAVGIPVAMTLGAGRRAAGVAAIVHAFSPTALFFASVVVATGVFAAWLQLGAVNALWESAYGRVLLLKLAALSGVFATGAYNWLRVRPALGDDAATSRLRRSAGFELAVGVVVLAITAVLVATATPATMVEMAAGRD